MKHDADILIAGGGLTGTALALALSRTGRRVALIDPAPVETRAAEGFDGRSYALALGSVRMLRALGLGGTLEEHGQPILEIKVSDGRAGEGPSPLWLHFDHAEIEEGPMGHMIEDRFLRRALLAAVAEDARIDHSAGAQVVGQEPGTGRVTVTLDDGRQLSGALLAGCDGVKSGTARRAGIRRTGWRYGQTALVCALEHENPHHGIAHQFFMPEGPLAILPLPGNRSSIVWTERDARAEAIQALDDDGYLAALRPRFGDFLGEIALAGARYTYPLELSLAQDFAADRVALVGDAAHRVHPIAGQGLNAGLRDVAALAQVLEEAARRGEDIGATAVLARYDRWRRFDTAALAVATDGFNRLFSNDNPLLRLGRDLGLGAVAHLPRLRRGFIREAAGLTGELPELMR
jgi:2-octaprenyl-6-methoxyphenol hydroxylase